MLSLHIKTGKSQKPNPRPTGLDIVQQRYQVLNAEQHSNGNTIEWQQQQPKVFP